ncbi:hypothetical protein QTO34_000754 [Cnephaeus nilssonii]|uniref:Uncharacterized protein n=1 Tax=Cnephaeus nilssonii TaxID=3371016 RepID=A0AA40IC15_CNENI|nr:hypothetical protein QTO34_000754 [Eptesicus nilssonii]
MGPATPPGVPIAPGTPGSGGMGLATPPRGADGPGNATRGADRPRHPGERRHGSGHAPLGCPFARPRPPGVPITPGTPRSGGMGPDTPPGVPIAPGTPGSGSMGPATGHRHLDLLNGRYATRSPDPSLLLAQSSLELAPTHPAKMKCDHCTWKECSKKTKTNDQENAAVNVQSPAQENGEKGEFRKLADAKIFLSDCWHVTAEEGVQVSQQNIQDFFRVLNLNKKCDTSQHKVLAVSVCP